MSTSEFAQKFDDGKSCIRLYNNKGEHILSILPCDYTPMEKNNFSLRCDLANPDGKVLYCGIEEDLVKVLAQNLGIEDIVGEGIRYFEEHNPDF
jgi:hypothetical protein